MNGKNKTWKLAAMFSIMIFLIMTVTMFLIGGVMMLLSKSGLVQQYQGGFFFSYIAISIILGTLFAKRSGRGAITAIVDINEATKKIAKGDFDIKIAVNTHAKEINEMAHNFTLMAQALSNMETFRSDFITNVSHEFKTPLSAIEGYAALLQNKTLHEDKREAYIEKILLNTKRLSSLTTNILQLSNLENQEIVLTKNEFSLDEQIRQTILLFEQDWNAKRLNLDIELAPINFNGNEELLAQVWQNLIVNAMKYTTSGDTIRIMLRKEEGYIRVCVSDTGAGMSKEVKERVFEKFYQGDTTHSSQGNGLGLTLVKRIIDLHNGSIVVSSKEGKGTTFDVAMPVE